MSTSEKRIVASRPIIGTRPAPVPVAEEPKKGAKDKEGGGRGKTGLLVGIIVVLVLGGAAAYWFLLGPGAKPADPNATGSVAVVEPVPEAGEVQPLEPVSLNLAGGRYLRIGVALQLTKDAEHVDTAKAVDTVLTHYSGRTIEEVSAGETREQLRTELETKLAEVYDGAIMGVYLTDYVTQ